MWRTSKSRTIVGFCNNGCLQFICWHGASCYNTCPSVYLSFIFETQTDSKWINKDGAKNWQWVCLFCGACWLPLGTDNQSVSGDWVTERGSGAGRTLMGVMLMSSEPINKPPVPSLSSPRFWSLLLFVENPHRWVQTQWHPQHLTVFTNAVLVLLLGWC